MYATQKRRSAIKLPTPYQPVIMTDQAGALLMAMCAYLGTCIIQCACCYLYTYYSCRSNWHQWPGTCVGLSMSSMFILPAISIITWCTSVGLYNQMPSPSVPPGAYGAASILGGCTAIAFAGFMHVHSGWHILHAFSITTGAIFAFCVLEYMCGYLSGLIAHVSQPPVESRKH